MRPTTEPTRMLKIVMEEDCPFSIRIFLFLMGAIAIIVFFACLSVFTIIAVNELVGYPVIPLTFRKVVPVWVLLSMARLVNWKPVRLE